MVELGKVKGIDMKRCLQIMMLFAIVSCKRDTSSMQDFDWLIGNWVRTNDQPNRMTYENWSKVNDSVYNGLGYTMVETFIIIPYSNNI
jgi:hypothetical protein